MEVDDNSRTTAGGGFVLRCANQDERIKNRNPYKSNFYMVRVFEVLQSLRNDGLLFDVELETDDGRIVFGHKVFLASASPYFQAMFTRFHESHERRVRLGELDSNALKLLIDYIYSGEIVITEENVQIDDYLAILEKDIPKDDSDLSESTLTIRKDDHKTYRLKIPSIKNADELWIIQQYNKSDIENVSKYQRDVVEGDEFLSLSWEQVVKLISSDELTVESEEKVFECVIGWVNHVPGCRKDLFPKLLEHVRLQLVSKQYLLKKVEEEPLLKNSLECKKYIIEALNFHQLESEQHGTIPKTICSKPRQPVRLPKVILMVGGEKNRGSRIVEWYDPVTNQWQFGPEMRTKSFGAELAVLKDCVFALGGFNDVKMMRSLHTVDKLDLTSPSSCWVPTVPMLKRRAYLGVTVLGNCIYAIGGYDGDNQLNSAEVFDCTTQSWQMISNMSTSRFRLGVGVLNNIIYAVGGYDISSKQILNSVECYDPRSDTWTPVAEMRERRRGVGVGVLDGVIYAVGGWGGSGYLKSVEAFRPSVGVWTSVADMYRSRSDAGVVALDGLLYVVGGNYQDTIEVYDPKTNTWSILSTSINTKCSDARVVLIKPPNFTT